MIRTLAPSGSPIRLRDLLSCVPQSGADSSETLRRSICETLGVRHAFLFANGRGAMVLLMQSLLEASKQGKRTTVILPSFTCYSVAASAILAGLNVRICDVNESTLSYSEEQLLNVDFDDVLAIVSTSLYGIPTDLRRLEAIARDNGVFLIDDAAQCLGATVGDRPVGTFGDAGLLSFDKGKVITSINGGVLVTNDDEIAAQIHARYSGTPRLSVSSRIGELVKLQAYAFLLHPLLYTIPSNLPGLGLGRTVYDENIPVRRYFEKLSPIVQSQLQRLESINGHRRIIASRYEERLANQVGLSIMTSRASDRPIYLRYPVRIEDKDARGRFLQAFKTYGCSISYPNALPDVEELAGRVEVQNKQVSGGRIVASQLVTLPTHAYVRSKDIDTICDGLLSLVDR